VKITSTYSDESSAKAWRQTIETNSRKSSNLSSEKLSGPRQPLPFDESVFPVTYSPSFEDSYAVGSLTISFCELPYSHRWFCSITPSIDTVEVLNASIVAAFTHGKSNP
jgi:hypothetical protein